MPYPESTYVDDWKIAREVCVCSGASGAARELSVVNRGNHCEIHLGDAIAADYVATKRLATLFAAAPELLDALREAKAELVALYELAYPCDDSDNATTVVIDRADAAIAKAEGSA
jgi:hypothetical protein